MIAEDMIRIEADVFDDARQSQLNHTPIISRRASAARLPTIHPFAAVSVFIWNKDSATCFQEILLLREEFIVCEQRDTADACRCQINETGGGGEDRIGGVYFPPPADDPREALKSPPAQTAAH